MPLTYYLAAVDTILACLVTLAMGGWVGILRAKYKIPAPAVVGECAEIMYSSGWQGGGFQNGKNSFKSEKNN